MCSAASVHASKIFCILILVNYRCRTFFSKEEKSKFSIGGLAFVLPLKQYLRNFNTVLIEKCHQVLFKIKSKSLKKFFVFFFKFGKSK